MFPSGFTQPEFTAEPAHVDETDVMLHDGTRKVSSSLQLTVVIHHPEAQTMMRCYLSPPSSLGVPPSPERSALLSN